MGKRSTRDNDGDTRVLFKKSQHTIYTQSKTCSGLSQSQINTSGIIQIKKTLSQTHQYYIEGEKMKRDLSTETGICILRRYYKKKMNKLSTQEGSKTKYSAANSKIDTIKEFLNDNNNFSNSELTGTNDIAKIMMDNFKYLLNNWIEKYLLENKETKEKSESVLYSLLHKTELDRSSSSSKSTYVLNREGLRQEVKNKKVATASILCQHCKNQNWIGNSRENSWKASSCHSTPASHKNIKVISNLSIPKNLYKKSQDRNSKINHKIEKSRHKNLVVSINKPSKIFDYSSFDLLTISTKSFTKRCATYDCDGKKKQRKKKRHIVFLPKPIYKSATDSTTDENKRKTRQSKKNTLEPMPSLMKSIYADDPANITSTDDNVNFFRNDNYTMTDVNDSFAEVFTSKISKIESKAVTDGIDMCDSVFLQKPVMNEEDRSDPMMTIDFMNESLVFSQTGQPKIKTASTKTRATDTDKSNVNSMKQTKKRRENYNRKVIKIHRMEKKRLRIKKNKMHHRTSDRFVGHCQNILKYFADYENKKNMKLDIHITVLPISDPKNKSTEMSTHDLINIYEQSHTAIYNIEPTTLDQLTLSNEIENSHNIIPLLDGADNQRKFVFKSESCSEKTTISQDNNAITFDRSTITDVEIKDDIKELKSVIKDLAKAAETFVKEHTSKKTKLSQCDNDATCKLENVSKGIQFSKEASKIPLISGIKLSKEPKKVLDINEFYNRLMQKSTSYNVIDSESILRVTDMTSAANEICNTINKSAKSLPNSRSLVEVTNDIRKKRLLTYYCGEYNKNDYSYNSVPTNACPRMWLKLHKNQKCSEPVCSMDSGEFMELTGSDGGCDHQQNYTNDDDVEKCLPGVSDCHQRGMGFGEGCFYCMLMWIPVILIASLLYSYVIKEAIYPKNATSGLRQGNSLYKDEPYNNGSSPVYNIKLSDLGF